MADRIQFSSPMRDVSQLTSASLAIKAAEFVRSYTTGAEEVAERRLVWLQTGGWFQIRYSAGEPVAVATELPGAAADPSNPGQMFGFEPSEIGYVRWSTMGGSVLVFAGLKENLATLAFSPGLVLPGLEDALWFDYLRLTGDRSAPERYKAHVEAVSGETVSDAEFATWVSVASVG